MCFLAREITEDLTMVHVELDVWKQKCRKTLWSCAVWSNTPLPQHSVWSVSQLCLILFPPLTKTKMVVWLCLKTHKTKPHSTIAWLSDKAISKTRLVCRTPKGYIAKQKMTKISCLAWHSRKCHLAAASFISFSYLHQVTMTFWNSLLILFGVFFF